MNINAREKNRRYFSSFTWIGGEFGVKYMDQLLALKILGGGGTRQSRRYLSIMKRLYSLKTLDMLLHPWTRQQLGGLKRLQQLGAMRRLPYVWAPWRLHRKYCIDVP